MKNEIGSRFTLKDKSIDVPYQCLGNKVSLVTLEHGSKCQIFSSSQYVHNDVKHVEDHLVKKGERLPTRAKFLWSTNHRPETDIIPELSPTDALYFQSLIGVLRQVLELNRVGITMKNSSSASTMTLPRENHLKE